MGCVKSQPNSSIIIKNSSFNSRKEKSNDKDNNDINNNIIDFSKGELILQTDVRGTGNKPQSQFHQPHVRTFKKGSQNFENYQRQSKIKAQQMKQSQLMKAEKQSKISFNKSILKSLNSNEENYYGDSVNSQFHVVPPSQAQRSSVIKIINQNPQNLFNSIKLSGLFKNASSINIKTSNYQQQSFPAKTSNQSYIKVQSSQPNLKKGVSQSDFNTNHTKFDDSNFDLGNNNNHIRNIENYKKSRNHNNHKKNNEISQTQVYSKHQIF